MEYQLFEKSMAMMFVAFGKKIASEAVALYWELMHEISDDKFQTTVASLIKNFKPTAQCPFPVPADFLAMAGETDKDLAVIAISKVKYAVAKIGRYHSVDFKDPALHMTIQTIGGWTNICNWTDEDWQLNERRFSEAYSSHCRRGESGPEYLPGVAEISNGSHAFDVKFNGPLMVVEVCNGRLSYHPSDRPQIESVASKEIEDLTEIVGRPM
jgi:Domain of unknown function (DUF6475)